MRRATVLATVGILLFGGAAAGCGSKSFDAQGFVDEVDANGGQLVLGPRFPASPPGKQTYSVELQRRPGERAGSGEGDTRGSLSVYDDTAGADEGTAECEAATGLLCFQGANVVLVFEGETLGPAHMRLAAAIKKLAH